MINGVDTLWKEDQVFQGGAGDDRHVTKVVWDKLKGFKTEISGFALIQATAYAIEFNNQRSGIHAGDWDSYKDFASVVIFCSRNTSESLLVLNTHLT